MVDANLALEKFRQRYPKRRIIFIQEQGDYDQEYLSFNMDILRGILPECPLLVEFFENRVLLTHKSENVDLFSLLLLEGGVCSIQTDKINQAILTPFMCVTDVMALVRKILSIFEESA